MLPAVNNVEIAYFPINAAVLSVGASYTSPHNHKINTNSVVHVSLLDMIWLVADVVESGSEQLAFMPILYSVVSIITKTILVRPFDF